MIVNISVAKTFADVKSYVNKSRDAPRQNSRRRKTSSVQKLNRPDPEYPPDLGCGGET